MKDFDFDELDRAVNSVLTKKDTPSQNAPADSQTNDAPAATSTPVIVHDQDQPSIDSTAVKSASDTAADKTSETTKSSDDSVPVRFNQSSVDTSAMQTQVNNVESSSEVSVQPDSSDDQSTVAVSIDPPAVVTESKDDTSVNVSSTSLPPGPDTMDHAKEGMQTVETSDVPSEDTTEKTSNVSNLSNIPVKRGRFMDVVAPGVDQKSPMPTRTGITISPSTDFSSSDASSEKPTAEVVSEPETTANNTPAASLTFDEKPVSDEEVTTEDASAHTPEAPKEDGRPFILDAPVEKRPLNSLASDTEAHELLPEHTGINTPAAETQEVAQVDVTQQTNAPKEFDKEIMAVEAHETVGNVDTNIEPNTTSDHTGEISSVPVATAAVAEPHPIFDTSTLGHDAAKSDHHSSKATWAVVGISLFIVGAALGVLYFLYGQA